MVVKCKPIISTFFSPKLYWTMQQCFIRLYLPADICKTSQWNAHCLAQAMNVSLVFSPADARLADAHDEISRMRIRCGLVDDYERKIQTLKDELYFSTVGKPRPVSLPDPMPDYRYVAHLPPFPTPPFPEVIFLPPPAILLLLPPRMMNGLVASQSPFLLCYFHTLLCNPKQSGFLCKCLSCSAFSSTYAPIFRTESAF